MILFWNICSFSAPMLIQELPLCIKWPNDIFVNCEGKLVKVGGKMIDPLTSQSPDTTIANVGMCFLHSIEARYMRMTFVRCLHN